MDSLTYSYEDLEKDCIELADIIQRHGDHYTGIIAIAGGGLLPAYMLSKLLGLRAIRSICVSSYSDTDNAQGKLHHHDTAAIIVPQQEEKWLIVDDIAETFKTLDYICSLYPNCSTVTPLVKNEEREPDFFCRHVPLECWIDFSWEVNMKNAVQPKLTNP